MSGDNNFEILLGGEPPEENKSRAALPDEELPVVKKAREENNIIMDHFDNCKWNLGKQLRKTNSCCGRQNQETLMYFCDLLKIESLQPLICERCQKFSRREEN